MMQGVAGLQANNMSPKAMAAGGIVAFQEGGRAEDEVDPALNAEMMRFIESQRQAPTREAPRQPEMGSLARQGIRNLIGTLTPQEVFRQRQEEATRAAGYSPEERDKLERHLKDRESIDARRFDPEKRRSDALTQFLLNAAGRTGIGSVLAGGGAGIVNFENAMDAAERAAMVDRQKHESGIIDVGPASRLAGMKLGSEGERTAMTGLAQGTGDAIRLEQIQAAAAKAGINPEDRRITQAYQALNGSPEIRALLKTRETLSMDDPNVGVINQKIYEIAAPMFRGRGLDPDLFMPRPQASAEAPAPKPGYLQMFRNAMTPTFGGSGQPAAPRAPSGQVDLSNPNLK
jgi:hypothetical protein